MRIRDLFQRSDPTSWPSRQKATAKWQAGTSARSAGHWKSLKKNAAKGQAWWDSQV